MTDSDAQDYTERHRVSGTWVNCDECARVIPPRATYLECTGLWDDEKDLYNLCRYCEIARILTSDWARKLQPPILDPPPLGNLWPWIEARLDMIPEQ